tara:strand:- start:12 stop:1079 length:1068 start_codon:yes stop_codon:yes gene_type:complete
MAILPAGSFNTSKRVYTALKVGDVVEGGVEKVTRGLWSGNVGTLTSFHTSSAQSDIQKQYYYEVFDGISTGVTSESQFSITYGHNQGSGSLGQNEDSPSNAIYSQYAQILLPDNQRVFKFNNTTTQHIYAINMNRARLKDRLDPGNFQLNIAKLTGASTPAVHGDNLVINLIDNSGDTQQSATQIGRVYSLVSGSILDGVHPVDASVSEYGSVYPEQGVIILNAAKLDLAQLNFGTNVASNTNGDNAFRLFTAISGAAAINANNGFAARNEEKVQSTFYFIRAKNGEYNFSNNPSFTTGSNGAFKQKTFANNPKSYITTVGLYNSTQELLAVAKLSKPILKSFSNEVLVKVKLDF